MITPGVQINHFSTSDLSRGLSLTPSFYTILVLGPFFFGIVNKIEDSVKPITWMALGGKDSRLRKTPLKGQSTRGRAGCADFFTNVYFFAHVYW